MQRHSEEKKEKKLKKKKVGGGGRKKEKSPIKTRTCLYQISKGDWMFWLLRSKKVSALSVSPSSSQAIEYMALQVGPTVQKCSSAVRSIVRQGKVRQGKARQGKARHGKDRKSNAM